ncbi:MAG: hypothetical protein WA628_05065 [Terriglobales bacterium]
MVRWIAFDDDTAEAVVSRLRRGAAEIQSNSPVDAALQSAGPSVIVLPSSTPGKLLIARFSQRKNPAVEIAPRALNGPLPAVTTATVLHRKPAASVKKTWWRKIVA